MKKKILIAMMLFASLGNASAQAECYGPNEAVNGDFQSYTGTISSNNTWINNNLDNWTVSHGTPSASGNLAIWMWSYNGSGEGVFMGHNFVADQTYRLTYDISLSTDANPSSTFLVDITNGLTASSSTAYPSPVSQFSVSNQSWNFSGSVMTITETFTVPTGQNFSQLWFRPFLAGSPTPNQAAVSLDNITIEQLIECPCEVTAAFEYVEGSCEFNFFNASVAGANPANQILGYSWDFGDGSTSTEENPVHTYTAPGTYDVCLTTWAGSGADCCTDVMCQTVVVAESCSPCEIIAANLGATVDVDAASGVSTFTATEIQQDFPGAVAYYWNFGDGSYGTGQVAEHAYATGGNYIACCTVFYQDPTSGDCCSYEVCIDVVANFNNINENEIDYGKIELYPNPSTGIFNVKIKKDEVESIEVYSMDGLIVNDVEVSINKKVTTIDATGLSSGMYMVIVSSELGGQYSKKLIVK